jgi:hypothetical protein
MKCFGGKTGIVSMRYYRGWTLDIVKLLEPEWRAILMLLRSIEDLIRDATYELLGVANNNANKSRVRIAWPTNGAPSWKITDNVIYLRVYPVDEQYNRLKDIKYRPNNETSIIQEESYTRVIAVDWILYGPSSFEDADTIRNEISKIETLTQNNVFLVYSRTAPVRMPELFNGQWWERSSLTMYFYEQVTREHTVPSISGVQVIIKTEKGDENIGDITT